MEWSDIDFRNLIDVLISFALIAGAVLYMIRRWLAVVYPTSRVPSERALVLQRSEQSSCSGCRVSERQRSAKSLPTY